MRPGPLPARRRGGRRGVRGVTGSGPRRWIIDPIDGTKNFVRGIPVWATLLALEVDGALRSGVASAPALGRRWWAGRGLGAFAGTWRAGGGWHADPGVGHRRPRRRPGFLRQHRRLGRGSAESTELVALAGRCWRIRGFGDFWSHILVAEGACEIGLDPVVSLWDLAALQVIVEEAGGRFTDLERRRPARWGQRDQQQRPSPRRGARNPVRPRRPRRLGVGSPSMGYIEPGVWEIDTLLGGWERVTAGYLIEGRAPVLIETGSQSSVPAVLEALSAHGVGPGGLAGVAVTHIHLDHAGGVGDVARAFPQATVYVHERGARHLVDPERLVELRGPGLRRPAGLPLRSPRPDAGGAHPRLDRRGGVAIGPGRTLTTIDSPGHAKHHLALHDSSSGIIFAGDAVGVRLPDSGVLRPATPPADFDLDQAFASLAKFRQRQPKGIALAHYGLVPDPMAILEEAEGTLRQWAEVAERAWREGTDIAVRPGGRLRLRLRRAPPEQRKRLETLNGVHSNAAGLQRWLETTKGADRHHH